MAIAGFGLVALIGLAAGWLTNLLAERFPVAERSLFGPLHCVRGGEPLQTRDVLPLLGYLWQRGRCRHCGKTLPWRFPVVEGLVTLTFLLAWAAYQDKPLYLFVVNAFYIFLLSTIGLIDWRYRLIFPVMIWLGCLVGLLVSLVSGPDTYTRLPENPLSVGLGALVGGGIFYLVYIVAYAVYRRRALGFGDVLLAILIGVILGFPRVVSGLFLGAVLGGVVAIGFFFFGGKRWRDFIPYGTTLCLGVVLIIIWGETIWGWGPFGLITWGLQLLFGFISEWVFGQR